MNWSKLLNKGLKFKRRHDGRNAKGDSYELKNLRSTAVRIDYCD
jgi:hypothetical protein